MKLGDGVEAAIHCATMLAGLEQGRTLPASALAEYHGVSPSYLLKHLKELVGAKVFESVSGPHGGYRLARAPDLITLLDIVLAVEGPAPAFRCAEIRQRGPGRLEASTYVKPCGINTAMLRAERAYRSALAETKLSDIVHGYLTEADPRAITFACSFVARNQRPQA